MGLLSRFRSSLTYPIAATVALVTVVPVVAVGLLLARNNQEHLQTLEKQHLTRQAVSLADEASLFFSLHRTEMESTALGLEAGRPLSQEACAALVGEIVLRDPAFLQLQIPDMTGTGAFVRTRQLEPRVATALSTLLAEAFEQAAAGEIVRDMYRSVPGMAAGVSVLSYPLRDRSGSLWGVFQGVLDLAPLEDRLRDRALGGLLISIIDESGTTVASSHPELRGVSLAGSPLVQDFLRQPLRLTQVYTHPVLTEGSVLGSVSPMEWPPWGVVVERPTSKAFATVRAMQVRTLAVTAVAALAALAIGFLLSRHLLRPVADLAEVTSEVAKGNLAVRASISGGDEIAQLAENFNRMAASVEALVRRLKKALRQNQELFLETIRTLAAAIDAKDRYTRGHAERVSSYSMAIARHLGLSHEEVFRVRIAAILHDVGKLGVRDSILNKPGSLTDDEYEVMKRHPAIGAQIMRPIRMLKDIIPGIRSHHETLDGQGYPDGLKGQEIPLPARIIGVADTFDAMTTDRPYQKALTLEYVVAKMRSFAGVRFDSDVVGALLAAVAAGDITPPSPEYAEAEASEEAR